MKLGSSFFTLVIESSTSSLMWSIPITFPVGPTCGGTQGPDTRLTHLHIFLFFYRLNVTSPGRRTNEQIRITASQQRSLHVSTSSCGAHHSSKARGQDSTAGADVQGFGSLVKLVMQKLQGISVLGKKEAPDRYTALLPIQPQVHSGCRTIEPNRRSLATRVALCLLASAKCSSSLVSSDVLSSATGIRLISK